jgi:hypothetical protein
MVKEAHSSTLLVTRSPTSRLHRDLVFKESRAPPTPSNLLTKFARCTADGCQNKKQPGTPRCCWHNRWLYKIPTETLTRMFEQTLDAAFGSGGAGAGAGGAGANAVAPLAEAKKALDASQTELWAALEAEHKKHGVCFEWPSDDFIQRRCSALQGFLAAVARELVQPSGSLDISDAFAIDAVIERMYMVRCVSLLVLVWRCRPDD